jgi:hypothetical protein
MEPERLKDLKPGARQDLVFRETGYRSFGLRKLVAATILV